MYAEACRLAAEGTDIREVECPEILERAERDFDSGPARRIAVGDVVRYHPVLGEADDGRDYTIRWLDKQHGRWVAWLEGKAGYVLLDALSKSHTAEDRQK